jgi:adenylate cyclase
MRHSKRLRIGLFLGVGIGAALLAFAAQAGSVLRSQELSTVDIRFSLRGSQPPPDNIVVVGIDDATFSSLRTRWPFPRRLHAQVIDALRKAGAKVIAYDVQFTEPTDFADDNALIHSIKRARNVVLATTDVNANGETNVLGGGGILDRIHAVAANALLPTDLGGVVRRVPYDVAGLKSFAVETAERASGRRIAPPSLGGSTGWIDYVGPPGTVRTISFWKVLDGKFDPSLFRNKVVVVGPVALSLQDVHPTSFSNGGLMAGAEVEANAISTALRGFPLQRSPGYLNDLLIVLLAMIAPLACMRLSPFPALLVAVGAGGLFALGAQLAFNHGWIVAFVYPSLALVLSVVFSIAFGALLTIVERERIRDVFGRFVPEQVVDQVLAQTGDGLRLGGTLRTCTMMFTDLRGFTTFSEARSADDVIAILNFYFGEMSQAVLDHGGTLVSYLGDGMMAVFGAPLDQPDHADRALAAAQEMIRDRLPRVNAWIVEQGYGDGFRMGVGLNSGPIMAGNIGSERRLEYTTIGDTVNTASRLEGLTKGTPYSIFVSDSTRALLHEEPDDLVYVAELDVRGKNEKVKVWSLYGLAADDVAAALRESGLVPQPV